MNGTVLSKTDLAAWRGLLARPSGTELLLSAGIYLLASLIFPFAGFEALCGLFIAACIAYLLTRTHAFGTLLAPGIPALALFALTGSAALPALFLALLFGGAAGAILLLGAKKPYEYCLPLLLSAASFVAAWLTGGLLTALTALIPLPLALVGFLLVRRCKPFCSAVATLAGVLVAILAASCLVALLTAGTRQLDVPAFADALEAEMLAVVNETADLYPEMDVKAIFSPLMVHNMVALAINLAPGILVAICLVVGYFVWRTLCTLLVAMHILPRLPRVFTTPLPSAVSAIVLLATSLVALFAGSAATLTGAVAENVALILIPVFALIGFAVFFGRQRERSCLSVFLLIGLAYLLFNNPLVGLKVIAVYGAIHALILAHRNAKANNRKGET